MKNLSSYCLLGCLFALPMALTHCSSEDSSPDGGTDQGTGGSDTATGGNAGNPNTTGGSSSTGGEGGEPSSGCPAETLTTIEPDHANLQYSGRFDFTDPKKPRASASGVTVTAKFHGSQLTVLLDDEFKWNSPQNINHGYYDVIIDDMEPIKIAPEEGVTEYDVPVDLECGDHVVTLMKRTEASIGAFEFLGFKVAELLEPPAKPTRRIAVIGDSITCGSGNEADDGSAECSADSWGQPYQSSYKAWGSYLGRTLNAERHTTCVSGIGLVRNYTDQYDGRPMPEVYDLLYSESQPSPDPSPAWDTADYVPDAIVIGLGTNDFSPGVGGAQDPRAPLPIGDFVDAYIEFIDTLKGYYPNVHVFISSSPMLGNGWPTAQDTFLDDQKEALTQVEAHYDGASDVTVKKVFVTKITGDGCGTHPSAAQQEFMAGEIATVVKAEMGW